ncbi:MAG: site-specific integrase [Planctomycetota bacterium]|nr:MAG: site-specific integrase [Planctomycetota bacterium]
MSEENGKIIKNGETWKLTDGTIVRRRSRRMRVVIERLSYNYKGERRWSKGFVFRKQINRREVRFPLGTDAEAAARLADEIAAFLAVRTNTLDDALARFDLRGAERRAGYALIGDVFRCQEAAVRTRTLRVAASTARGYRASLVHVLRYAEAKRTRKAFDDQSGRAIDWTPFERMSTTRLTGKLVLDYQAAFLATLGDDPDEEEVVSRQISCDSILRQARAVFSKSAMSVYRHAGINIPDLSSFFEVPMFNRRKYHELLPVGVIERIFAAAPQLRRDDPNAWRAFVLCVHLGLRKSEAAAAEWSWVEEIDGTPTMSLRARGKFNPKHGHGRRVQFAPWVWQALRQSRTSLTTIIDGTPTERNEAVFERLNAWLRRHGIDSSVKKPTHELRKLWFSFTVKTKGLLAAQQQGGHYDPKVTSDCYAHNLMPDSLIPFWTVGQVDEISC